MRRSIIFVFSFVLIAGLAYAAANRFNLNPAHHVGDVLDSYRGVNVYYNGAIGHVSERNLAPDGYNLGLKFQCVEFVKRYYYERFGHKLPQDRGNAVDFFDAAVPNGALNAQRGLLAINHEYTDDGLLHAGGMDPWNAAKVRKSQAAHGVSVIHERVYDNRMNYVGELRSMGARITTAGQSVMIEGPSALVGTAVRAHDVRAGAAVVIAGLCAEGAALQPLLQSLAGQLVEAGS